MKHVVAALLLCGGLCAAQPGANDGQSQGVVFLNHSLNARLHPVPVSAVKITDGFWAARTRLVPDKALPQLLQSLEEHGAIDNFLRAAGAKNTPRKGRATSDADLYHWIEAASWVIASPDTAPPTKRKLQAQIEGFIPIIAGAQDASGYLDTYFSGDRAHLRFTDPIHSHEDACLGHLIQAGIAYYRATGKPDLLNIAIRFADNVVANFGPNLKPFALGRPGLEMALVELYRTTRETKYLDFARYLLTSAEKDRLHLRDADIRNLFSGKPFTSHTELDGQVVNALNAASGATDYFAESGDPATKRTIDQLWTDLNLHKLSVTGGVSVRPGSELFGGAAELSPNAQSFDTPAAVRNVAWSFRLLTLTADARYADVLERALYNAVSAGLSPSGTPNCARGGSSVSNEKGRAPYYDTDTCPPEVVPLLASLPGYFYASGRDGVYVNLYNDSELDWKLEDGTGLKLLQTTGYPWNGDVKLTLYPAKPSQFTVYLRWPSWAASADILINGNRVSNSYQRGTFMAVTRTWQPGDVISASFPVQTVWLRANRRADALYGKVAIERGPIVYVLDQSDQPTLPLADLFVRAGVPGTTEFHRELPGGSTTLKVPGLVAEKATGEQPLYETWSAAYVPNRRPSTLTYVPYFSSNWREQENVEIWVPSVRSTEPATAEMGMPAGERKLAPRSPTSPRGF